MGGYAANIVAPFTSGTVAIRAGRESWLGLSADTRPVERVREVPRVSIRSATYLARAVDSGPSSA